MRVLTGAKIYIVSEWAIFKQLNRNIRLLLWSQVIMGFVVEGGILPVLFNLYLLRLNFGPESIGSINSVGLVVFTLVTLPAGEVGKRIGLRKAIMWGLFLMFVGFLFIPMGEFLSSASFGPAFAPAAGNAILHVGLALFFVNNPPFIMKNTTGDTHASVFGLQSSILALSGFVGSLAAGFIPIIFIFALNLSADGPAPIRYTLILGACSLLLAAWFMRTADSGISLRDPIVSDLNEVEPTVEPAIEPEVDEDHSVIPLGRSFWIWIAIIGLCRYLIKTGVAANGLFYNVYLDDGLGLSTSVIGNFSALGHLLAIPAGLLVPFILKRFGAKNGMLIASGMLVITLIPLTSSIWWLAGLGHALTASLGPVRFGVFTIYVLNRTPAEQQPFVSGLQELIIGGAFATMAVAGGYLISWTSYSSFYWISIGVVAFGTLLMWAYLYGPLPLSPPAAQVKNVTSDQ
ncbi:MAG: MFS transporter [Anaerolineae bacterium]